MLSPRLWDGVREMWGTIPSMADAIQSGPYSITIILILFRNFIAYRPIMRKELRCCVFSTGRQKRNILTI
jgi:hypothetical protein